MRRHFITTDVFTDTPFGGNPLAVLPNAEGLTTDQMQKLAREFNLSETVFVLRPQNPANTRRIRIFVPTKEIPFAGHPTIGTALVLASMNEFPLEGDQTDIVLEAEAGPIPVTIRSLDGQPVSATLTAPQLPTLAPAPPTDVVAAMLSLEPADIIAAEGASCGNPFLIIQVKDRQTLARSRIDVAVLEQLGEEAFALDPFIFTDDAPDNADFQARMYAPLSGIPEDPATGSAAAAFAGWLGHHTPMQNGLIKKTIAQGIEMGRPSRLDIEIDKQAGKTTAVRVTGTAVPISEGQIVPPAHG